MFSLYLPVRVLFGTGSLEQIGKAVKPYGKRALLVTTGFRLDSLDFMKIIEDALRAEEVESVRYEKIKANPTLSSIMEGIRIAKEEKIDVVIGIGGGSAIDAAKSIALGATHDGTPWDYLFFKEKQPTAKTLPIIAVTTTSGTGSHVTKVAVLTNDQTHCKSGICSEHLFPKVGIVDPRFTCGMPSYLTATTAFDAFTHAFESLVNVNGNNAVDDLARRAMELIVANLPHALTRPSDLNPRENLAYADTLAGMTIANVGTTLPHAMGQPISGHFSAISHGESLAMVYPEFVRCSYAGAPEKFAYMIGLIHPGFRSSTDITKTAASAAEAMREYLVSIGLADFNYQASEQELDILVKECLDFPDMFVNPVVPDKQELRKMFVCSFGNENVR